jgi:hypothetical protein
MGVKGIAGETKYLLNPLSTRWTSKFRSSWTKPEGVFGAVIVECRVVNVNLPNWTVDCNSIFDRRRFFDIQVASPYLHPNNGDGISCVPDVGAKCVVCVPSDGSAPFVMAYIMPPEQLPLTEDEIENPPEAFAAKRGSTYAGGRKRPKLGDIRLQGRDGNFCILHRGGVLQIGSSELSQRICIPLGNLMTDISENYNHFNTGGSINWGIVQGSPDDDAETEYKHTFRVFANDEFADIRASFGKIHEPVPEPVGDEGESSSMHQLGIATDAPVTFEFCMAPGGFETDSGTPTAGARDGTKFKIQFDRDGGGMIRAEGAVTFRSKKSIWITADEDLKLRGKRQVIIESGENSSFLRMWGSDAVELGTGGGVLTLNGGTKPVATVGSIVNIVLPIPLLIMTSFGPGTILAGQMLTGIVSTGNPTIKV